MKKEVYIHTFEIGFVNAQISESANDSSIEKR